MVSTPGNLEANWSGGPSSIYSFSISHILKREFFCLGRFGSQGSKEKKWICVFLSNFWGCFFKLFVVEKKLKNILATELNSGIKKLL